MVRVNMPATARDASRMILLRRSYEIASRRSDPACIDISSRYPSRLIDYHSALGVDKSQPLGNMSFCELGDGTYLVSVRQFGYSLMPYTTKLKWIGQSRQFSGYHLVVTDRDFNFIRKINSDIGHKVEDIRLMRYGYVIQASYTDLNEGFHGPRVGCMNLRIEGDVAKTYDCMVFPAIKEKNYMPVEREGGAGVFVTDLLNGELKMASRHNPTQKTSQRCVGLVPYRGSTPIMKYGEGYVSLVHRRMKGHRFYNAFAFFDKNLLVCRLSDEFTVFSRKSPVSFCCGMSIDGDDAVLPICIHDRDTYLFRIPLGDFRKTARMRS